MRKKQSVEQYVFETLERAILSRKLAPGKQLVETTISNQLNVSRTPIRNAIKRLEKVDLVEVFPNKGAFVTNPSRKEILQAYDLRKELEILAAKKAINYLTETDFEYMEACIEREKEALKERDLITYLQANRDFHMAITTKADNRFLSEFVDKLINQTNVYLILFDSFFETSTSTPVSPKEHQDIIILLRANNWEELSKLLIMHFENSIKSLSLQKVNEYKDMDEIF